MGDTAIPQLIDSLLGDRNIIAEIDDGELAGLPGQHCSLCRRRRYHRAVNDLGREQSAHAISRRRVAIDHGDRPSLAQVIQDRNFFGKRLWVRRGRVELHGEMHVPGYDRDLGRNRSLGACWASDEHGPDAELISLGSDLDAVVDAVPP